MLTGCTIENDVYLCYKVYFQYATLFLQSIIISIVVSVGQPICGIINPARCSSLYRYSV